MEWWDAKGKPGAVSHDPLMSDDFRDDINKLRARKRIADPLGLLKK